MPGKAISHGCKKCWHAVLQDWLIGFTFSIQFQGYGFLVILCDQQQWVTGSVEGFNVFDLSFDVES